MMQAEADEAFVVDVIETLLRSLERAESLAYGVALARVQEIEGLLESQCGSVRRERVRAYEERVVLARLHYRLPGTSLYRALDNDAPAISPANPSLRHYYSTHAQLLHPPPSPPPPAADEAHQHPRDVIAAGRALLRHLTPLWERPLRFVQLWMGRGVDSGVDSGVAGNASNANDASDESI